MVAPLTVPSQDMIIGLYYLTAARDGFPGAGRAFIDFDERAQCLRCALPA